MELVTSTSVAEGERVVARPILRDGTVIFVSLIPDTSICSPGGTGWLMELDQNSGGRFENPPFDVNGDEKVEQDDKVTVTLTVDGVDVTIAVAASAIKSKVGIITTPAIIDCEEGLDCKKLSGSTGNIMELKENPPPTPPAPGGAVRRSWIQLR